MKTIILCGGKGSRLGPLTESVPKPLIRVGGLPIFRHIINLYKSFEYTNFVLPIGHKGEQFKLYLDNIDLHESSLFEFQGVSVGSSDQVSPASTIDYGFKCTCIETGEDSLTVDRLLQCENLISDDRFFLTYGDGIGDVDLHALHDAHVSSGKLCTITAVHPPARFGQIAFYDDSLIASFNEKTQVESGWINGGFMVFERGIFDILPRFTGTMLEDDLFQFLLENKELNAYKHDGFWQCVDTARDLLFLETLYKSNVLGN